MPAGHCARPVFCWGIIQTRLFSSCYWQETEFGASPRVKSGFVHPLVQHQQPLLGCPGSPEYETPADICARGHIFCCIHSYAFIRAHIPMSEQTESMSVFKSYFHNHSLLPFFKRSFSSHCRKLLFNVSESQFCSNTQNS